MPATYIVTSRFPEPIMTRWETWLKAALFYANNFEIFLIVIKSLKDDVNPYQ